MADATLAHDVSGLNAGELERARRDLQVSLTLAFPGSPVNAPLLVHMSAMDTELGQRQHRPGGTESQ
jgi:hypothetical protein